MMLMRFLLGLWSMLLMRYVLDRLLAWRLWIDRLLPWDMRDVFRTLEGARRLQRHVLHGHHRAPLWAPLAMLMPWFCLRGIVLLLVLASECNMCAWMTHLQFALWYLLLAGFPLARMPLGWPPWLAPGLALWLLRWMIHLLLQLLQLKLLRHTSWRSAHSGAIGAD